MGIRNIFTLFVFLVYLTSAFWSMRISKYNNREIILQEGPITGLQVELNHGGLLPVNVFKGIQYHTTRGKILRFFPPRPSFESWSSARPMYSFSPPCVQTKDIERSGSKLLGKTKEHFELLDQLTKKTREDCLSLNIYVPSLDKNDTTPFPVMVFVHGESYDMGTGNAYDGSVLASFGRVIVVTVNYRLGVLGFLSTGDRDANGNQALLDLLAVLTWIKENIASFDGNPNSVTLFGHGHGAALVNFLMMNRVINIGAKGDKLFHRAILQSGSAYSTWASSVDPVTCAQKLAINVNCSHINKSNELIQCLKNRTADELVQNAPIPPKYFSCFAPTLKNPTFFPESSIEKLIQCQSGLFTNINVLFGITKNEAYSYLKQSDMENGISQFRKSQILRTYVQNVYKYHRQKIFEILDHQYSEWDRMQDDKTRRDNIMELLSDGQYVAPLVKMAREHSKYADSYFYTFGYSTQSESEKFPKWSSGVHGDELPYVFGAPLVDGISPFPSKYTRTERELSAFVMRMWTNFAKSGNPNHPMKTTEFEGTRYTGIDWPKYDEDKELYLQIGRRTQTRDHYRGKQMALWLDLLPKINVEDSKHVTKPDSAEHNLYDPKNMSTFDEPGRLMNHFRHVGPPLLNFPSMTPPQNDEDNSRSQTGAGGNKLFTSRPLIHIKNSPGNIHELNTFIPDSVSVNTESVVEHSVPLSITVALGCTLLFFNILIFAGVYYQKERMRKIKESRSRANTEDVGKLNHTDTRYQSADINETTNLMSNGESLLNQLPSSKIGITEKGTYVNDKYSPTTQGKDQQDRYLYTPLPTAYLSPIHRKRDDNKGMDLTQIYSEKDEVHEGRSQVFKGVEIDRRSDKSTRTSHDLKKGVTIV